MKPRGPHLPVVLSVVFALLFAGASNARAQEEVRPPQVEVQTPLRQWDFTIAGRMPKVTEGKVEIRVLVDGNQVDLHAPGTQLTEETFIVQVQQALVQRQKVVVQQFVDSELKHASAPVTVGPPEEECPEVLLDCRDSFEASFYLGLAIDTFAGGDVRKFLNPEASGNLQERAIGGFDFGYRLAGQPKLSSDKITSGRAWLKSTQLWVYGETVHGTRSTEIFCQPVQTMNMNSFASCPGFTPVSQAPDKVFFILRNATSLEAFAGLRWEFLSLQKWSKAPASLYLKGQAGFANVVGGSDDVADIHHIGLGAITTKGLFQGSYLEVGFGRTDLFQQKEYTSTTGSNLFFPRKNKDRWKVDALLSRRLNKAVSLFVQFTLDADVGSGADSVQSYFGLDFDMKHMACWFGIGNCPVEGSSSQYNFASVSDP